MTGNPAVAPGPSPVPSDRLADRQRDALVAHLRDQCADGRLDLDEFADRTAMVLRATTWAEAAPALDGLPEPGAEPPARPPRRRTVGVLSGNRRRGPWRLLGRHTAVAVLGHCTIDLTEARLEGTEPVLRVVAVLGGVEVVVPEGVGVELDGLAVLGARSDRLKASATPPSVVLAVRATTVLGGVTVRHRDG